MNKNNKLLILFYLPSFTGGGSEIVTINLANQFYKLNHNIFFLCSNSSGPLFFKLDKNIKIVNLKKKRLLFSLIDIYKFIKKNKPDVIFSSLIHSNIYFCILKKFFFLSSFLIIRHGNTGYIYNNFLKKIKNLLFNYLITLFYRYSDLVVSSGHIVKNYLIKQLKINKSVYQINNPIFIRDEFTQIKLPKNQWLRKNKFNYFISVGRLAKQKNFNFLIESFKKLSFLNLKLLIIGDGIEKKPLLKKIKNKNLTENIKIINFQKNILSHIYYSRAFVLSSLWEGQSNVLLQSALLNKKIICASTAGDAAKLSKQFTNINIYTSNNFKSFRNCIIKNLQSEVSKSKIHDLAKNFDSNIIAKKYIKLVYDKK